MAPALSFAASVRADRGILISLFGPPSYEARLEPDRLLIAHEDRTAEITLNLDPSMGGPVYGLRWHNGHDEISLK